MYKIKWWIAGYTRGAIGAHAPIALAYGDGCPSRM
jgi:hypothetical protein